MPRPESFKPRRFSRQHTVAGRTLLQAGRFSRPSACHPPLVVYKPVVLLSGWGILEIRRVSSTGARLCPPHNRRLRTCSVKPIRGSQYILLPTASDTVSCTSGTGTRGNATCCGSCCAFEALSEHFVGAHEIFKGWIFRIWVVSVRQSRLNLSQKSF